MSAKGSARLASLANVSPFSRFVPFVWIMGIGHIFFLRDKTRGWM